MSKIVGIGANVYDTLIKIPRFPVEDTKLRAESIIKCGGGPCATGLVAAAKLGGDCAYIGNLSDDDGGRFLKADLEKYNVSTEFIDIKSGCLSFSSFVLLNSENATRTCVVHRGNVPSLVLDERQKNAIINAEVLLVDGNELDAAVEAAKIARNAGVNVLYDAGGLYEGIEKLLPFANILIPSEEFALGHTKTKSADEAAKKLMEMYNPDIVVITQGKRGGILYDGTEILNYPALDVDEVIDTNGAGDVFHGAYVFGLTKDMSFYECCIFSSAVSALKCTKIGARQAVPALGEVMDFLKESGYNEFEKKLER